MDGERGVRKVRALVQTHTQGFKPGEKGLIRELKTQEQLNHVFPEFILKIINRTRDVLVRG